MLGQTAPALIEFFDDRGDGERILGALFIAAVHDETHVRNTLHGAQTLKFVGFTVHTVVFNHNNDAAGHFGAIFRLQEAFSRCINNSFANWLSELVNAEDCIKAFQGICLIQI